MIDSMKIALYVVVISMVLLLASCGESYSHWEIQNTIELEYERPMGIAIQGNDFWISDAFDNSVNRYDSNFKLIESVDGFERPMHITANNNTVYIPEYGSDKIITIQNSQKDTFDIPLELDAPAGFDIVDGKSAVVNFYGHSIVYGSSDDWIEFGEDGEADGNFHSPTDVQIFNDTIYVADAYNHRVQVFDNTGKHLRSIGEDLSLDNVAGLFVTTKEIFVTDFENHRVLVLDRQGNVLDEINEGLDKPIDLIVKNDRLFVINFGSGEVVVLKQQ